MNSRTIRRGVIALLASLCSLGHATAAEYRVELLDENDGFPSSIIFSIVQDPQGFLWFGTGYDGVVRFDGENVSRYIHDPEDPASLPHNNAGNLAIGPDGQLWIGGWGSSVMRYDHARDVFIHLPHVLGIPNTVSSSYVQNIFYDSDGQLWFGTFNNGLNKLNPDGQTFTRIPIKAEDDSSLASRRVWDFLQTTQDGLWIGTDGGLNYFDLNTQRYRLYLPEPDISGFGKNRIRHLARFDDNHIVIGTHEGVVLFNPAKELFSSIPVEGGVTLGPIYSLLKTSFSQYWVTSTKGVYAFSEQDPVLRKVPLGVDDVCSQTLFEDRQNIIWLSCEGVGVYKITRNTTFNLFDHPIARSAYALEEGNDGSILIGTEQDGIYKWYPDTGALRALSSKRLDKTPHLSANRVLQTDSGEVWFANVENLYRLDERGNAQKIVAPEGTPYADRFHEIKNMIQDHRGWIWVATRHGVFVIKDLALPFEYIGEQYNKGQGFTKHHITEIYQDGKNRIWIASFSGLYLWSEKGLTPFYLFKSDEGKSDSDLIYAMLEDERGQLWLGSQKGLVKVNESSRTLELIDLDMDIDHLGVRFIQKDTNGYLWLITPTGISRYHPQSKDIQHFGTQDGLSGTRYFVNLSAQTKDGIIYVPSRDGIQYFDPVRVEHTKLDAPTLLTDIDVLGAPETKRRLIPASGRFELRPDENYLKLEFATLDFLHAKQIHYHYKLEGFDQDWVNNGTNNTVMYTNLRGGDYVFRVRPVVNNNLSYDTELSVPIHIATPFYLQNWMMVFYAGLIILLFNYYIQRRSRRNELEIQRQKRFVTELEQQVSEKTATIAEESHKLAAANKVKSEFLANMSHEIRTPLTAVIGQAESIISGDISPDEIQKEVGVIHDNSLHLLALLNDILDLTKIEQNKFELEKAPCDLHGMLSELKRMFSAQADAKGLRFQVMEALFKPLVVNIDALRLKQILINLCSNAVKFTQRGEVVLSIDQHGDTLVFSVKDTGIGMSKEQLQQIFDAFTQGDTSINRRFGGTGLGLSLSKRLASLMGGEILVKSILGLGSEFTLSIPVEVICDSMPEHRSQVHAELSQVNKVFQGRILLAEDHDDNRRLIARLLTRLGLDVVTARDGHEAIARYHQHRPEVLLLDIQMPTLDGIQAFKRLREQGCKQPIIALTANAMSHDITQYQQLGFDGYLKKPLDRQLLVATLARYYATAEPQQLEQASQSLQRVDMSDIQREFAESLEQEIEQFTALAKQQDYDSLLKQAHRLQGAASLFGFSELATLALTLERAIKVEQGNAAVQAALSNLLAHLQHKVGACCEKSVS